MFSLCLKKKKSINIGNYNHEVKTWFFLSSTLWQKLWKKKREKCFHYWQTQDPSADIRYNIVSFKLTHPLLLTPGVNKRINNENVLPYCPVLFYSKLYHMEKPAFLLFPHFKVLIPLPPALGIGQSKMSTSTNILCLFTGRPVIKITPYMWIQRHL